MIFTRSLKENPPQRRRKFFRIIPTLRYLKSLGAPESSQNPLALVGNLRNVFQQMSELKSEAFVYTDGSTATARSPANSGCSVVVTDQEHKEVWSGGLTVRTDGNNFVAEVAAAAMVIKACPVLFPITLRIDSEAAIGALAKGTVSERKRIRAPGRPWLNFCREDLFIKQNHIKIEHVRSHVGRSTPEQIGNDLADGIAKEFCRIGELQRPVRYFTHDEEHFVFTHQYKYITGDARTYLKALEESFMIEVWKSKAPRQAEFFSQFPVQLKKMARQVWNWAVVQGDGNAWLYFIFGACQWLPTQHRLNKHRDVDFQICLLCRSGTVENMEHLWVCPALAEEQMQLQTQVNAILEGLPFSLNNVQSRQCYLRQDWLRFAKKSSLCSEVSEDRLNTLTLDFWNANKHKPFIPIHGFSKGIARLSRKSYPGTLSPQFLALLIEVFSLNVEGFTNPLHHFSGFDQWCSSETEDREFGAIGSFFESDLYGKNTFCFPDHESVARVLLKAKQRSNTPSRILMLLPTSTDHKFLVIAHISGCPIFSDSQSPTSDRSRVLR